MTLEELSDMMIAADGDESTNTVDEAAFLRVMAQRASDEIKDTDALLATFKALDLDDGGVLEVNEIVEALANVEGALAETDRSAPPSSATLMRCRSTTCWPRSTSTSSARSERERGLRGVRQHGGREAALRTCMHAE